MFKSASQAGQDLFVFRVLGEKKNGFFLDIGCGDCIDDNSKTGRGSNTLRLTEMGWKGIGIDNCNAYRWGWEHLRHQRFVEADVSTVDWNSLNIPSQVDYISFDVDDATYKAVNNFPWNKIRSRVITIDHSSFRLENFVRDYTRSILEKAGYTLLCGDVAIKIGDRVCPTEDWWVDSKTVDMNLASKFKSIGELGQNIADKDITEELYLPVSIGEGVDKYSILQIKRERINSPEKLAYVEGEIAVLSPLLLPYISREKELYENLVSVNTEIWDMSERIRTMDRKSELYTEILTKIMDKNEERYNIKASINNKTKSKIKEQKSYNKNPIVYVSGGKLGDFIHSLYVIMVNYTITGKKGILYISDTLQPSDSFPKGAKQVHSELKKLLLSQEYIEDCLFDDSSIPKDFVHLGKWRFSPMLYLTNWCNLLSGVYEIPEIPKPWLKTDSPKTDRILIHHRIPSPGRETTSFPWKDIVAKNSCIFITCDRNEYDAFPHKDKVSLKLCQDLDELIREISSAKIFVGNQTAPLAIACALHIPILADLLRGTLDSSHYKDEAKNNPNFFWIWENEMCITGLEKYLKY